MFIIGIIMSNFGVIEFTNVNTHKKKRIDKIEAQNGAIYAHTRVAHARTYWRRLISFYSPIGRYSAIKELRKEVAVIASRAFK